MHPHPTMHMRRTDHLVRRTFDGDLTRLGSLLGLVLVCGTAYQSLRLIEYKCRGIRRQLDGSQVDLHACALDVELLHAGRWKLNDRT